MAIIRTLNKVENVSLHNAILLTTLVDNGKYNFTKVYIDPSNECAIYFEEITAFKDYEYNYDDNTTAIYTRDGWKY